MVTFGGELRCILLTAYFCLLVNVDALRPSHQMFSNTGMVSCLPVLNQISFKQRITCNAHGQRTVPLISLEAATPVLISSLRLYH